MLVSTILILGFAAVISAAAIPADISTANVTTQVLTKRGEGSCTDKNLPIEWMYNTGVSGFCNGRWGPTPENPNPTMSVGQNTPIISTVHLNNYESGQRLNWVYKIWVDPEGVIVPFQSISLEQCHRKMKEILSENHLGSAYCVVDGTEDVLFQSGTIELRIAGSTWGKLIFESYRRRDIPNGEIPA